MTDELLSVREKRGHLKASRPRNELAPVVDAGYDLFGKRFKYHVVKSKENWDKWVNEYNALLSISRSVMPISDEDLKKWTAEYIATWIQYKHLGNMSRPEYMSRAKRFNRMQSDSIEFNQGVDHEARLSL